MSKAHISVKVDEDKLVYYELEFAGEVIGEMSAHEVLMLLEQGSGALRFATGEHVVANKLAR